jgi:membrane protein DedA with SNARE-associated domain
VINYTSLFIEGPPFGFWAYLLLGVSVIFEGPLATLLASVAASAGYLNPFLVFVWAVIGNTIGDTLWYYLGYVGTLQSLGKYLRWLGLRPDQIEQLEVEIHANARRLLFIAKLTLGFVVPTLIATGLARVPWRRWAGALFLAECLWTGSLVTAGYFLGAYLQRLEQGLRYLALGGSLVFFIVLSLYVINWRKREINRGK